MVLVSSTDVNPNGMLLARVGVLNTEVYPLSQIAQACPAHCNPAVNSGEMFIACSYAYITLSLNLVHVDSVGLKAPIIRLSPLSKWYALLSWLLRLAVPANKYRLTEIVNEVMLMLDFKVSTTRSFIFRLPSDSSIQLPLTFAVTQINFFVSNFQYNIRIKCASLMFSCNLKTELIKSYYFIDRSPCLSFCSSLIQNVFHVALSSAWCNRFAYRQINVDGVISATSNTIKGSRIGRR